MKIMLQKTVVGIDVQKSDILLSCSVQIALSCDEAGLGDTAHRESFDWQQEVSAVVSTLRAT